MQEITPKKYIESRARKLALYRCFVTKNWKELGLAHVIVLRKHNNGNITMGVYLVDLFCMGVKDSAFKFNITEWQVKHTYNIYNEDNEEIDYKLAHNIVYAAYEYALELGINQAEEFKTTRFILEEDDDNIPLINIVVGDPKTGKPHLMVPPGEERKHKPVYDHLLKTLGKYNFDYSIIGSTLQLLDLLESTEFVTDSDRMDDLSGIINNKTVQKICSEDLFDDEKYASREEGEQIFMLAEIAIRHLRKEHPELMDKKKVEERAEYLAFQEASEAEEGEHFSEMYSIFKEIERRNFKYLIDVGDDEKNAEKVKKDRAEFFVDMLALHPKNVYVVGYIYIWSTTEGFDKIAEKAKPLLEKLFEEYPLAGIFLASASQQVNQAEASVKHILKAETLSAAFPTVKSFGKIAYLNFWIAKFYKNFFSKKVKQCIYYFELHSQYGSLSLQTLVFTKDFLSIANSVIKYEEVIP